MNDAELVRFLLARVDDDENELKVIARKQARGHDTDVTTSPHSVDRLRAECTSKRVLIGNLQQLLVLRDQPFEKPVRDAAVQMLHSMAVPYADHSGYRQEWAAG